MLEALFRSVPDVSMRIQFRYEISEHLGDLLNCYIHEQRTEQSEVMALDSHRLRMWRQKENSGFFFENRLHVYLIWDPRIHAKLQVVSARGDRCLRGGYRWSAGSRAGEVIPIPPPFEEAIRKTTAAVCCVGCKHTHVAVPPFVVNHVTNKGQLA